MALSEVSRRGRALECVQQYEHVGSFADAFVFQVVDDIDSMPEGAKVTCPTQSGNPVAGAGTGWCRAQHFDSHASPRSNDPSSKVSIKGNCVDHCASRVARASLGRAAPAHFPEMAIEGQGDDMSEMRLTQLVPAGG